MVGFFKAQIKLVMFVEIVQRPKWVDAMKKRNLDLRRITLGF
jgi:hypothetical protein